MLLHWNVSTKLRSLVFKKRVFMKLTAFVISRTKQIYPKTLTVSKSTIKMKAISTLIVFEAFVTSTVVAN